MEKRDTVNFVGGLNTRVDPTSLKSNEFTTFKNINLVNGTLKRRDGFVKRGVISKLKADKLNDRSWISIPDHNDYNTYHVGSAYDKLSMYFQLQIQIDSPHVIIAGYVPLIYKKNSFFLFHNGSFLQLYYKRGGATKGLSIPYKLENFIPVIKGDNTGTSSQIFSIGLQYNNASSRGITFWLNGYKINDHAWTGGSYPTECWDDYDIVSKDKIYLGYYDGLDYASSGFNQAYTLPSSYNILDFRIYRTNSTTTTELAISDTDKRKYAIGRLPTSELTNSFLKGYFKLGDSSQYQVLDSTSTANHGSYIDNNFERVTAEVGTINARKISQLRTTGGTSYFLIDGGGEIWMESTNDQGEYISSYSRDADFISNKEGVTISRTSISESISYSNKLYIAVGEEKPLSYDGSVVEKMGIVAPTNAPTLKQENTPGSLQNGYYYYYKYTFYDNNSGLESNPSPNLLYNCNQAGGAWIQLYVDRSDDLKVTHIKLYRTKGSTSLPQTEGVYFLHSTNDIHQAYTSLNDTAGYEIEDNTADSFLSSTIIDVENDSPPNTKYITEHHDKIFLAGDSSNPHRLYYSKSLVPESFPAANYIDVGATYEGSITGLNYARGRLFIFKEKAIWQMIGTTDVEFSVDYLNKDIGCIAPYSRVLIRDLIFFASVDGIYVLDVISGNIKNISETILPTYTDLDFSTAGSWIGVSNNKYNQYILNANGTVFVYDYFLQSWGIWDIDAECAESFFENNAENLYTAYTVNNKVYIFQHNQGNSDGVYHYGEVHNYGSDWIKNIFASFGDLTGFPLYVFDLDGNFYQRKKIISNTSQKITVDSAFSPSITGGKWFSVGGIPVIMETGWIDMNFPQLHKKYRMVDFVYTPESNSKIVLLFSAVDHSTSYNKRRLLDLTGGSGDVRWSMSSRGRFIKLKLFAPVGGFPLEIKKMILGVEDRGLR